MIFWKIPVSSEMSHINNFRNWKKQLDKQNEFFSKEIETLKKNRIELLEIKKKSVISTAMPPWTCLISFDLGS